MTIKVGTIMSVAVLSTLAASIGTLAWVVKYNSSINDQRNNTIDSIIQKSGDEVKPSKVSRKMIYATIYSPEVNFV